MNFTTNYDEILVLIERVNPTDYAQSRNYINGAVSRLSPYISRGVISTKYVFTKLLNRGFMPNQIEKFIQELAWRDYWQQVWIVKKDEINKDLKHSQFPVTNRKVPLNVINAKLGISAIDKSILELYDTGYMHNHARMYTASIICNMAYSHWLMPAKWLYYYLLDADWASNALSWQWVAGANANKKYVANQENINKYCNSKDAKTFLDVDYSAFSFPTLDAPEWNSEHFKTPEILLECASPEFLTKLPKSANLEINHALPSYIYNWYNLDPKWAENEPANRILLLEPSIFNKYPISEKSVQFMLDLSQNIPGIKIYTGEFSELVDDYNLKNCHYKEHPLNSNYKGTEHPRDWMFETSGYYGSFFKFWNRAKKELNH